MLLTADDHLVRVSASRVTCVHLRAQTSKLFVRTDIQNCAGPSTNSALPYVGTARAANEGHGVEPTSATIPADVRRKEIFCARQVGVDELT